MDIDIIYRILKKEVENYQVPIVDLIHFQTNDPFKVLVTTILSARTKDDVTTTAAKRLFTKISKPIDINKITTKEIEKLIFPVGFYQNKARFLKELPDAMQKFDMKVPKTIEELLTLPGVGRKTANLVLAIAYDIPAICVDTHVHRIMNKIGYVKTKTPLETEMALRKKLPKKYWTTINSIIVAYGQYLCRPIGPKCVECKIQVYCQYYREKIQRKY